MLGQHEVHDLIQCVEHPKHRTVLLTLYAAGLRLAEATHRKLPDIDSQRMQLKINGGKGGKDRYVPLSPRLLEVLRQYWKEACPFLVDNKRLGRRFREAYLAGLWQLAKQQQSRVAERPVFEQLLNDLQLQDWVVFVQPPPRTDSDPSHVLRYLARYMTGGPISDRRLLRWDGDHITFAAQVHDKSGRQEPVTLTAREFIRRWSLHILPAGFVKATAYGGWSNTQRHAYRDLCESLAPSVNAVADLCWLKQSGVSAFICVHVRPVGTK